MPLVAAAGAAGSRRRACGVDRATPSVRRVRRRPMPPTVTTSTAATMPMQPLNPAPLTDADVRDCRRRRSAQEQCYRVRAVALVDGRDASRATPSAPALHHAASTSSRRRRRQGLRAVADDGPISLIWEPNTETDLAATWSCAATRRMSTLQPLTAGADPRDARYRDTDRQARRALRLRHRRRGHGDAGQHEPAVGARRGNRAMTPSPWPRSAKTAATRGHLARTWSVGNLQKE